MVILPCFPDMIEAKGGSFVTACIKNATVRGHLYSSGRESRPGFHSRNCGAATKTLAADGSIQGTKKRAVACPLSSFCGRLAFDDVDDFVRLRTNDYVSTMHQDKLVTAPLRIDFNHARG